MQERYIHIDENEYEQFYNLPHSKHKPVEQVCADYDAWMAQYNGGEAPQDEVPRVSGPF